MVFALTTLLVQEMSRPPPGSWHLSFVLSLTMTSPCLTPTEANPSYNSTWQKRTECWLMGKIFPPESWPDGRKKDRVGGFFDQSKPSVLLSACRFCFIVWEGHMVLWEKHHLSKEKKKAQSYLFFIYMWNVRFVWLLLSNLFKSVVLVIVII